MYETGFIYHLIVKVCSHIYMSCLAFPPDDNLTSIGPEPSTVAYT